MMSLPRFKELDMAVTIGVVGNHRAVHFAGSELARYLKQATGKAVKVVRGAAAGDATFRVGVAADLGVTAPAGLGPADDWVRVRPEPGGKASTLTGVNPRSVLFAVYRYLQAAG